MADAKVRDGVMKYKVLARYGAMRTIGTFSASLRKLSFGDKCMLCTDRGTEWGEVVSVIEETEGSPGPRPEGSVLRRCVPKDYEQLRHIEEVEQPKEFTFCAEKIAQRGLQMRLVSVEHIFGGEKIIFYFLSEVRVDFRDLVKDLATEYRTRIELRQIGVRDEARLLAEYEHCGRELCCRTFMRKLEPVTMRMAKLQKTTLDPTKISGRCGRLMCCLRFEDEAYAELKARLPKKGTRVKISDGEGEVVSTEILPQSVTVELPGPKFVRVKLCEILEILAGREPQPARKREAAPLPRPEGRRPTRSERNRETREKERGQDMPAEPAQAAPSEPAPKETPRPAPAPPPRPEPKTPPEPERGPELTRPPKSANNGWVADEWWEEPEEEKQEED